MKKKINMNNKKWKNINKHKRKKKWLSNRSKRSKKRRKEHRLNKVNLPELKRKI